MDLTVWTPNLLFVSAMKRVLSLYTGIVVRLLSNVIPPSEGYKKYKYNHLNNNHL
jgi:hypothetical protein